MLGNPPRHASWRVAQHPAQQPEVVWAVYCLPPLERGNCARVRIFLMSVVIPECLPSPLLMNMVAILVRKLHEVKPNFLLIHISVSKSKASYPTAGNLKQVSACHSLLPSLFTTWRQQSSALIQNTRFDRLVTLTTVSTLFLSRAVTTEEHCRTDLVKHCPLTRGRPSKMPALRLPPTNTHAIRSHKTSAMSSQLCTSKRGNRCRKPQRQTRSEGGVNHKQLFLQWVHVSSQEQAAVSTQKKLTHYNTWSLQASATPNPDLTLMTLESQCSSSDLARSWTIFQNRLFIQWCRFQRGRGTVFLHQWLIQTAFPFSRFHFSRGWLWFLEWWHMNPRLKGD